MAYRSRRLCGLLLGAVLAGGITAEPTSAYLYWTQPNLAGERVRGDEPGLGLPMPGATPEEIKARRDKLGAGADVPTGIQRTVIQ